MKHRAASVRQLSGFLCLQIVAKHIFILPSVVLGRLNLRMCCGLCRQGLCATHRYPCCSYGVVVPSSDLQQRQPLAALLTLFHAPPSSGRCTGQRRRRNNIACRDGRIFRPTSTRRQRQQNDLTRGPQWPL